MYRLLLQHQPEGPYRLAGYSMGGAIVLEMAQQLKAKGREVSFLGIIDTPAQNPNLIWVRRATGLAARILRLTPQQETEAVH
jgi:thioesterase domain-containing protein